VARAVEECATEEQDPCRLLGRDRDGVAGGEDQQAAGVERLAGEREASERDVDRARGVVGGERETRAGREGRVGVEGR